MRLLISTPETGGSSNPCHTWSWYWYLRTFYNQVAFTEVTRIKEKEVRNVTIKKEQFVSLPRRSTTSNHRARRGSFHSSFAPIYFHLPRRSIEWPKFFIRSLRRFQTPMRLEPSWRPIYSLCCWRGCCLNYWYYACYYWCCCCFHYWDCCCVAITDAVAIVNVVVLVLILLLT